MKQRKSTETPIVHNLKRLVGDYQTVSRRFLSVISLSLTPSSTPFNFDDWFSKKNLWVLEIEHNTIYDYDR